MPATHAAKQANSTRSLRKKGMRLPPPFTSLCSATLTVQDISVRRISAIQKAIYGNGRINVTILPSGCDVGKEARQLFFW
jgi:hypothetical protein